MQPSDSSYVEYFRPFKGHASTNNPKNDTDTTSGAGGGNGLIVVQAPGVEELVDFGDAPTAAQSGFANSYPTTLTDNGARHTLIAGGPRMGIEVDSEADGQPTATADGDDNNGFAADDEDGVTFTSGTLQGQNATLDVDMPASPQNCLLNAWMDFNQDGDWEDNGEKIFTNETLTAGVVNNLTYAVPADALRGLTYARFRCSTQADLSYEGAAPDGEVEDYERWVGSSQQQVCVDVLTFDDFVAATPSGSAPPLTAGANETVDDFTTSSNFVNIMTSD